MERSFCNEVNVFTILSDKSYRPSHVRCFRQPCLQSSPLSTLLHSQWCSPEPWSCTAGPKNIQMPSDNSVQALGDGGHFDFINAIRASWLSPKRHKINKKFKYQIKGEIHLFKNHCISFENKIFNIRSSIETQTWVCLVCNIACGACAQHLFQSTVEFYTETAKPGTQLRTWHDISI